MERVFAKARNKLLLCVYIGLPVLAIAVIIAVSWKPLKKRFTKKEESQSNE